METPERQRFERLRELFHELEGLGSTERAQRLAELALENPEVHRELDQMFAESRALEASERALEEIAAEAMTPGANPGADTVREGPIQVGSYHLLRTIGEGGMGQVFEAEQREPLVRRVAVKLMRPGLGSAQILARFAAERQTLAVLEHPNIARVLDAGATEDARPWFAMELIDGVSITRWADREALSLEARIALFLPVCDAIEHAHRKGIIHRDLKPSNILVGTNERGAPLPKVIDFGIAKAVDQPLMAQTLATRMGELVGTPEYMSPEQATLGAVDVDTRSDVYGLGLVLYELLVGELPLPQAQIRSLAFDELCRKIREDETPRPSARLRSSLAATAAPGAEASRGSRLLAEHWPQRMRGELDAVLLKALAKDRERRYQSVADLAADLRRFLNHEAVHAAPPSFFYLASKFVRRHRLPVAFAALAVVSLLGGLIASLVGFSNARRAAVEARTSQRTAEATTDFLARLLRGADVRATPEPDLTVRELLDRGSAELATSLHDEPRVRAAVLDVVGGVHQSLGRLDEAEAQLREALELRQRGGAPPLEIAQTMTSLGAVLTRKEKDEEAERLLRGALRLRRESGASADAVASTLYELSWLLMRQERYDEAEPAALEALELRRQDSSPVQVARSLADLGELYDGRGEPQRAIAALEEAIELLTSSVGPLHLDVAVAKNNLAMTLDRSGEFQRAEQLHREVLEVRRELLGADSLEVGRSLSNLAWNQQARGNAAAAEELLDEALRIKRLHLEPDHTSIAMSLGGLVVLRSARGDYAAAEDAQREAIRIFEARGGESNSNALWGSGNLASIRRQRGDAADAARIARRALTLARESGASPMAVYKLEAELGAALGALGQNSEAEALLRSALQGQIDERGAESPVAVQARSYLEDLLRSQGREGEIARLD